MSEREKSVDDLMGVDEPYSEEIEEKEETEKITGADESPSQRGLDAIKYYLKEIRKTPSLPLNKNRNSRSGSPAATPRPGPG